METYHFEAVERVNTSAADASHQHECAGSSKVMIQSVSAAACHLINIGLRISLGWGCICSKVEEVGEFSPILERTLAARKNVSADYQLL